MSEIVPVRWQPDRALMEASRPRVVDALWRGVRGKCPACGEGKLFSGYLKVVDACSACGTPVGLARADDAPPYLTILLVGHIIIPSMLWLERAQTPPLWVHTAIWVPLTLVLCLAFLRPLKGMTLGALVANNKLAADGRE